MGIAKARVTKVADKIILNSPYNTTLVEEIRGIPGRRWNADIKAWSVPAGSEQQLRELVRQYYQIEGEDITPEYNVVRVRVSGKTSAKRTYMGGVTIDGREIFDTLSGYLDMRSNPIYEILEQSGGVVRGDSYVHNGRAHAFEVVYDLKMRVRKGAEWERTGRADYYGKYEFLPLEDSTEEKIDEESSSEL